MYIHSVLQEILYKLLGEDDSNYKSHFYTRNHNLNCLVVGSLVVMPSDFGPEFKLKMPPKTVYVLVKMNHSESPVESLEKFTMG